MARTKKNGVEIIHKRKIIQSDTEESEEEQPKQRKVFKKNHVYHVSEWVPDNDTVPGEIVEGGIPLPVKLKENIRLETPDECVERKAAYAEAKRIENEKKLEVWRTTAYPMVEIRTQATGLIDNKSITYEVSPNCYPIAIWVVGHTSASSKTLKCLLHVFKLHARMLLLRRRFTL